MRPQRGSFGRLARITTAIVLFLSIYRPFWPPETAAAEVAVPPGVRPAPEFQVKVFTNQIRQPRTIAVTEDGLILVTSLSEPRIFGMREDSSGKAGEVFVVADNVPNLQGICTKGRDVWAAESGRILHFVLGPDDRAGIIDVVIPGLPSGGGHYQRMVAIGPDDRLYTGIGSSSNIAEDLETPLAQKRQKIWSYQRDGSDEKLFCIGLRNCEKVDWDPATGSMWGTDHGSDNISRDPAVNDDNPTCEFDLLEAGVDYGAPYIVTDQHGRNMIRPEFADRPDIQEKLAHCRPSAIVLGGHVAPTGYIFYRGHTFPEPYRSAAFVCLHGSWNRTIKNGYRVDALFFKDGHPTEAHTVLNLLAPDRSRAFGRPVDAANLPDGSLLITDDAGSMVYRLTAR